MHTLCVNALKCYLAFSGFFVGQGLAFFVEDTLATLEKRVSGQSVRGDT